MQLASKSKLSNTFYATILRFLFALTMIFSVSSCIPDKVLDEMTPDEPALGEMKFSDNGKSRVMKIEVAHDRGVSDETRFTATDGDEILTANMMMVELQPYVTKPAKYEIGEDTFVAYTEISRKNLTSSFETHTWASKSGTFEVTAVNGNKIEGKFTVRLVDDENKKADLNFSGTFETVLEKY